MNFRQHLQKIYSSHRLAFILVSILALTLIIIGMIQNTQDKVITYLATMLGCFILSEFIYFSSQIKFPDWKIKQPKKELWVVIATQGIVISLLIYWFVLADQQSVSPWIRISTLIVRVLFVFPAFFMVYFLAIKKYSFKDLGILRFNLWYVAIPLIVLIGGVTDLSFPEGLQFESVLQNSGYLSFITLGFLTAAIPEEFTRMMLQTRLYGVLKNKSSSWFLASFVWSLFHIPLFAFQSGDYVGASISALGIFPIGLLWGYLNERYRSIIPSVLIHGTNLWGLQNIF